MARLEDVAAEWVTTELAKTFADEEVWWEVSACAHPAVPPPNLALLVFASIPSHARLGGRVGHAGIMALVNTDEATVRHLTSTIATTIIAMRRQELAAANGAGGDGAAWPPGPQGPPPLPGGPAQPWPPR